MQVSLDSSEENPDSQKIRDDDERLGNDHPFITIMKLSVGPFIFYTAKSFQDAIDLYFVKKAYEGVSKNMVGIVSLAAVLRAIVEGVATFFTPALAFKTTELVAKNENEQVAQLLVDFIRIGIIIELLLPLILYFSLPALLNVLGAPNELHDDISHYVFFISLISVFISVFKCLSQVLNGLGKTFVQSMLEMGAIMFSLFIGDPIMMFGAKAGPSFLGVNYYIGTIFVSIALTIAFFKGKFAIKPTLRMFISKPSSELVPSLKTVTPFFAMLVFNTLGPIVALGNIIHAANNSQEEYKDYVSTVVSSVMKPLTILTSMVNGLTEALKSSGTWAFNHGKLNRLKKLMLYTLIVPMMIVTIISPIMIAKPTLIMNIWIPHKSMQQAVNVLAPILFYASWILPISDVLSYTLIITGHPLKVFILQIIYCISTASVSSLLYAGHKTEPATVTLVYPISSGVLVTTEILMFIRPYLQYLYKGNDESNDQNEPNNLSAPLA